VRDLKDRVPLVDDIVIDTKEILRPFFSKKSLSRVGDRVWDRFKEKSTQDCQSLESPRKSMEKETADLHGNQSWKRHHKKEQRL
jgi:hypothetical protein